MRQCRCGGLIGQHELTGNRTAWSCRRCGVYEVFNRSDDDKTRSTHTAQQGKAGQHDTSQTNLRCIGVNR